jgi:large subunit ribosomal protein L18
MGALHFKKEARLRRKKRVRNKVFGTSDRPRLCVFRSAKHIYAQIIDDTQGFTIAAASSMEKELRDASDSGDKKAVAVNIGKLIAQRAKEKGISKVVFDRGGFMYHGRVKALSEGAREGGLAF